MRSHGLKGAGAWFCLENNVPGPLLTLPRVTTDTAWAGQEEQVAGTSSTVPHCHSGCPQSLPSPSQGAGAGGKDVLSCYVAVTDFLLVNKQSCSEEMHGFVIRYFLLTEICGNNLNFVNLLVLRRYFAIKFSSTVRQK